MRELFEASVGRRLVVRIWFHGVLLFAGVMVTIMAARHVMFDFDATVAVRSRPFLAQAVAERVLASAGDLRALADQVAIVHAETPLALSVYSAGGAPLATSVAPPLPPPSVEERASLAHPRDRPAWRSERLVVGAYRGGALVAVAVVRAPPVPSITWHALGLLGSAIVLAFVFVAAPLARSIARPVERLGALARELGAGNLTVRAPVERRDELGDLARSFNTMAGQIQRLRTAERELLGDVSHELRTPLARMRVVLDLAIDADVERVRRYLPEVATDLAELEQMVDDIIVSARLDAAGAQWDPARPPLHRSAIAVDDVVEAAADRFRTRWPDRVLAYEPTGARTLIDGDPALLRRALDNLLDNARKYSPDDTPISIRVVRADGDVRVEVIDRGIGIAAEDKDRVFTAFFRADRSRTRTSGGVGLGLGLARRIVEAHGGSVGFDSELDHGSRFWLTLAVAAA